MPPKPSSIIAQVEASGTAAMPLIRKKPPPPVVCGAFTRTDPLIEWEPAPSANVPDERFGLLRQAVISAPQVFAVRRCGGRADDQAVVRDLELVARKEGVDEGDRPRCEQVECPIGVVRVDTGRVGAGIAVLSGDEGGANKEEIEAVPLIDADRAGDGWCRGEQGRSGREC